MHKIYCLRRPEIGAHYELANLIGLGHEYRIDTVYTIVREKKSHVMLTWIP